MASALPNCKQTRTVYGAARSPRARHMAHSSKKCLLHLFAGALLLSPGGGAPAQIKDDDPANLKGERVSATDRKPLEVDRGAKGLEGMLKKLATRASLLMIVAHPDDEDGGMLTYVSRGLGARTGMLTLTRGEGGQNVMSGDFNDALGLVRTRELLAADQYLGVDQMFGTEVDFGFSKTKEEAFSQWTHERVLYDAVRAVRLYRPLVLTSVFLGAPTDGHGQHQVSGEMAQKVFNAAADPRVFPEMGLPVWAPLKVYGRMPFSQVSANGMFDYATGKTVPVRFEDYVSGKVTSAGPKPTVMVPEGEASSPLGMTYVQFARRGLALQKSQIGGGVRLAPAGRFDVGYTRYGSRVGGKETEESFFDGMDVSLPGIAELAPSISDVQRDGLVGALKQIDGIVEKAIATFDAKQPAKIAPLLGDGLGVLDELIAQVEAQHGVVERERYDVLHELRVKRVQFNEALVDALGLALQAQVAPAGAGAPRLFAEGASSIGEAVPGESFAVEAQLMNASGQPVKFLSAKVHGVSLEMENRDRTYEGRAEVRVDEHAAPTRPPFFQASRDAAVYELTTPALRNAPLAPSPYTVQLLMKVNGIPVEMDSVVEAVTGKDAASPLAVVPKVSVSLVPQTRMVPAGERAFTVKAAVHPGGSVAGSGTVHLVAPAGWVVEPKSAEWHGDGSRDGLPFAVRPPVGVQTPATLTAVAESKGKSYQEGYETVGYLGLARDNLYKPATTRVQEVSVVVPAGLKVAYLPGTGDAVEESLSQLSVTVTRMSIAEIAAGRLEGYDALVMGVRAYAAHKDLPGITDKLIAFARAGGAVVVQYNTAEFSGSDAPYPLSLGSAEKVVEEKAPIRLLEPKAQVLSWPNRISEHDFDGWVEERGHGFMGEWDPRYVAVTEVHDAGQDPQRGGLLVAPIGKGAYVYCAYALYRQVPEGVPGAYRLLANMVSLGRHP